MELSFDSLINIATLLLGGGGGAFFTWKWMRRKAKAEAQTEEVNMAKAVQDTYQQMLEDKQKEVQDNQRLIEDLRKDRDHYRQIVSEMQERLDKTDQEMRELKNVVARNGRQLEMLRPFRCYDMKCKKRVLTPTHDCDTQALPPTSEQPQ